MTFCTHSVPLAPSIVRPAPLRQHAVLCLLLLLPWSGCSHGGRGPGPRQTVHPELLRIEYGRLVDVYGLRLTANGASIEPFERDVLIGPDIQDERDRDSTKGDLEILYDFFGSDPETLQPRLLIPRDLESDEFRRALDAVDDNVREVASMRYGTGSRQLPFSVVPRNAAIRLTFSAPLGVDDSFFVRRDEQGNVTGLLNTQAVQLLRITGDPEAGGLAPLPVRITVRKSQLTLDPVLMGSEGLQYLTRNRASGMPESPDQESANIRIALALEGPLAIPGLREPAGMRGLNNNGRDSIIRDFRSGNRADSSSDLANGFVRDPLPLRIVGEIPMYLEKVERINDFTHRVTIFKNGIVHDIDRGDVLRFLRDNTGVPLATSEVVVDPMDDRGAAGVQHVEVLIRSVIDLESLDPRNLPGHPGTGGGLDEWLVRNAPRAICLAEFAAGDGGITSGDDPRNFLTFTPTPLPDLDGTPSAKNENISPFAGAIVRFTKPVAMSSVKWADTFFFAMRDLTSQEGIAEFIASRPNSAGGTGMEAANFNDAKYRTPYLIGARVFDEDQSATALRLQPTAGFYLDESMRTAPATADHRYFLHLIANSAAGRIEDLSGNPVDLQGSTAQASSSVVIPFTVDTRKNGAVPFHEDNLAVSVVRRVAHRDEDSRPSYFLADEVPAPGVNGLPAAYPLEDLFGSFVLVDGGLRFRPTTRTRIVVDNRNQAPVASQQTILRWCPVSVQTVVGNELMSASNSATNTFPGGIQNPHNPYGSRLQMLWREVDLSLSRTDPFEFNLDIEQMYWAPAASELLTYDEFDRVSLFLGHSEYRPAPCTGILQALPALPNSGLRFEFQKNYVWNPSPTGSGAAIESQPAPHPAYVDASLTMDPASVFSEVTGINRFMALPEFQRPFFVFRDETVMEQGGNAGVGRDNGTGLSPEPYIVSPFNNGLGRRWIMDGNLGAMAPWRTTSFWNDLPSFVPGSVAAESFTGGLVGAIALPLLADFWTYCDSSELPHGHGYVALGSNGWQVALTVQSNRRPNFRVVSGGHGGGSPLCVGPGDPQWNTASGGFDLAYLPTARGDNTLYWVMIDALKRQSVVTSGFVDLNNPHRVPEGFDDPRLGPFFLAGGQSTLPVDTVPSFAFAFDPPLSELPGGTSLVPQFRGAGEVDPDPWYWRAWMAPQQSRLYPRPLGGLPGYTNDMRQACRPDDGSFPLDPHIAGDAHIRKWDTRNGRNAWTYFYNKTVTSYVEDPNQLMDPAFTERFNAPGEAFRPGDVRYVNWRFVAANNVDLDPPIAPAIETFALTWRLQRR